MNWLAPASVLISLALAAATGLVGAHRGFPVPDAARRIGCIDGLRGYLALAVMMHHFDIWTNVTRYGAAWGTNSVQWLANLGPGGVALFFMTTGLVFFSRIAKGFAETDWRGTYISRLFRILPLQIASIAVIAISSLMMSGGLHDLSKTVVGLAMWVTSYAEPPLFGYSQSGAINAKVLWSLWYEWVFYFVLLPLMALGRDGTRRWLPRVFLPLILLAFGLVVGSIVGPKSKIFSVAFYLPLFAFGMIAYELRDQERAVRLLASGPAAVLAVALLLPALLFAPGPYALPQILAYAFFFACVACGNSFGGLFSLRGSLVLGECSFGIYMIHGIVLFAMFAFAIPPSFATSWLPVLLPVAAVAAVLLGMTVHLAIERPMIRLGRQLAGWRKPRSSVERAWLDVAP